MFVGRLGSFIALRDSKLKLVMAPKQAQRRYLLCSASATLESSSKNYAKEVAVESATIKVGVSSAVITMSRFSLE